MNRAKNSLLLAISLSLFMSLVVVQSLPAQTKLIYPASHETLPIDDDARWDDGFGFSTINQRRKLIVAGERFAPDSVILLNGERQKTKNDEQNPRTLLIAKKFGEKARPGDRLRVQNPDAKLSPEFIITQ